jgi:hypothetical protein
MKKQKVLWRGGVGTVRGLQLISSWVEALVSNPFMLTINASYACGVEQDGCKLEPESMIETEDRI